MSRCGCGEWALVPSVTSASRKSHLRFDALSAERGSLRRAARRRRSSRARQRGRLGRERCATSRSLPAPRGLRRLLHSQSRADRESRSRPADPPGSTTARGRDRSDRLPALQCPRTLVRPPATPLPQASARPLRLRRRGRSAGACDDGSRPGRRSWRPDRPRSRSCFDGRNERPPARSQSGPPASPRARRRRRR